MYGAQLLSWSLPFKICPYLTFLIFANHLFPLKVICHPEFLSTQWIMLLCCCYCCWALTLVIYVGHMAEGWLPRETYPTNTSMGGIRTHNFGALQQHSNKCAIRMPIPCTLYAAYVSMIIQWCCIFALPAVNYHSFGPPVQFWPQICHLLRQTRREPDEMVLYPESNDVTGYSEWAASLHSAYWSHLGHKGNILWIQVWLRFEPISRWFVA